MDYPKLSQPILSGVVSIFFLVLAWKQETWPEWIRISCFLLGTFGAAIMLVLLIDWITFESAVRLREWRLAASITTQTRLAQYIESMTPDQLNVLRLYVPSIIVMASGQGPNMRLETGIEDIPYHFIKWFIRESPQPYLIPIRDFSDGTEDYRRAVILTTWLVSMGFADPAVGPHSAKWKNLPGALEALGIRYAEVRK